MTPNNCGRGGGGRGPSRTPLSALPEGWVEDPGSPYSRVLGPQHRVVVRAIQQYLRADVERSCHHVANLIRDERVATREETLRGPDQRDRTGHATHFFCGRAGGGHGR